MVCNLPASSAAAQLCSCYLLCAGSRSASLVDPVGRVV